jgi:hypothetical protein
MSKRIVEVKERAAFATRGGRQKQRTKKRGDIHTEKTSGVLTSSVLSLPWGSAGRSRTVEEP